MQLVPVLPEWLPQGIFGGRIFSIRPWAPQVPRAAQFLVGHLQDWFKNGVVGP
ncbi:MAG: hypothetical protein JSS19_11810 [Proteobacteria bacterium]|nr:hypothetical protein [Pseudomonadota bacterium]